MLKVRDIMTPDPVTLDLNMTLRQAAERLAESQISGAPVVRGSAVLGVLSLTDIVDFMVHAPEMPGDDSHPVLASDANADQVEAFYGEAGEDEDTYVATWINAVAPQQWDVLSAHNVAEAMTHVVFSVHPDAPVESAAGDMRRAAIHRLLVLDGGRLVGIVSALDVARTVAEGRLTKRTFVFPRRASQDPRRYP
ncbi:MAG TPA: CBS domain-containing protein [Gemmatimonadaceae bacterium]|jgi:CBS domain-containing protein|nr:CBS domain-containing protein [Gemmatimonadaceae bacterium]